MQRPYLGKILATAVIVIFFAWTAIRALGASASRSESAVFAGGCFWGVQAVFEHVKGVKSATSGYSGGQVKSPSYEVVSMDVTGHAESVQVTYDPSQITYGQLLMIYFSVAHDPTQLNRQGPDTGTQYRSAIFYANDEQKHIADDYIAQLNSAAVYSRPIVTKVVQFEAFYPAEDYHQDYLKKNPGNPYIVFNDLPKLKRLQKEFPALYRD